MFTGSILSRISSNFRGIGYGYLAGLALVLCLAGCTVINTHHFGGSVKLEREILLTTGDIDRPYRSIGFTQVTSTGLWLLGFIEVIPASLDEAVRDALAVEALQQGADAVININWYEMQYPLAYRFLMIFSVLSPQVAIVTGELVEFID